MKLKAVSVRVFELFAMDGTSLGLFKLESEWKGMRELKALNGGQVVIIDGSPPSGDAFGDVFGAIFADIFGEHRAEVDVVKISPELAIKAGAK